MKCLQRQKGLSMLSMCIGLSIAVLSYSSACVAKPEILVHAKSNMNIANAKQNSVNVEKRCAQKGQLLTSKEINSLQIKEKGNSDLLQLRAGEADPFLAAIGAVFLVLVLIAAAASSSSKKSSSSSSSTKRK